MTEQELIQRLLRRETEACSFWVREHHGRLLVVARSIVGDAQAEEVVQEAWIAAFRALAQFEGRSTLRTWLTRIVINAARGRLRVQKRMPTISLDDDSGEGLPLSERFDGSGHWSPALAQWEADSPEEILSREQLADCLRFYLGELPPAQQSALLLRDQSGLEFAEIAETLSTTEANVRVLLHRARLKLLAVINRYEEEGEC
ncbi:MAG: RNA polymerase sigma factor [Moraxellaceae bacterium]